MANVKMTKKDWFNEVLEIVKASEMEAEKKESMEKFIKHEIELLEKKHSKSGKSKTQKANEKHLEMILTALSAEKEPVTISTLLENHPELINTEDNKPMSNQKVSALLKKLVSSGNVVRTEEKKKAFFSIAKEETANTAEE